MFINTPFILASKSKSRQKILKNNNLNFKQIKPTCNESYYKKKLLEEKKSPIKVSQELSKLKAKNISKTKKNILVVGSDTTISFKRKLVEKAKNMKDAKKKITMLSGNKHTIISSISVYYNTKLVWSNTEKTIVKMRKMKNKEVDDYLKKSGKKILSSVGCYLIEKEGPRIIESIKGDFFNVMGFPLFSFLIFLKKSYKK